MKPAYIIAFVVIAACMVVTLVSFGSAMTHHVNVGEAKKRVGETVQVPGDIVRDSVWFDIKNGGLKFDIICRADKSQRMTIFYPEPKPENFDTANAVEAIGTYKNGMFVADKLLVKCPSKYSDEKTQLQPTKKVSKLGANEIILAGGGIAACGLIATKLWTRRSASIGEYKGSGTV